MTDKLLKGIKILITRAEHQSKEFATRLKDLGAETIEIPVIEIGPPDSWDKFDQALGKIDTYDWVIFASANAVRSFAARLQASENTSKLFAQSQKSQKKPRLAAIGKSTEKVASGLGLSIDYKPDSFIAERFVQQFPGYPNLRKMNFLWPRTDIGRDYIEEKFVAAGARIDQVPAYKTSLPADIDAISQKLHTLIQEKQINAITLASAQTAANLAAIIAHQWVAENKEEQDAASSISNRDRIINLLEGIAVISIGPETSRGALAHLGKVDKEASPHNVEGLIIALLQHFARTKATS